MKVGIAVSTYYKQNTPGRLELQKRFAQSLADHKQNDTEVVVIDDGSYDNDHLHNFRKYGFAIRKLNGNYGVRKSKNEGIQDLLDINCDFLILLDDDIEILKDGFEKFLIDAVQESGIQHLSCNHGKKSKKISEKVEATDLSHGYCMCLTPEVVDNIGYLQQFPFKYGFEHPSYSRRFRNYYKLEHWYYSPIGHEQYFTILDGPTISTVTKEGLDKNYKYMMENDYSFINQQGQKTGTIK